MKRFCVVDCNNFWSPSGGGVRRYHLEKLEYFTKRDDILYVFIMSDKERFTEVINETTIIEHIPATKMPGNWEYRFKFTNINVLSVLKKHNPDVIEVGSPYFMPWIIRFSISFLDKRPKVFGFWHADFPITYVQRFLIDKSKTLAKVGEGAAWALSRLAYNWMDGILVSSQFVMKRMQKHGLKKLNWVPLGVDCDFFRPDFKDENLIKELKAGEENRLTIFFPHRFSEEKGVLTLLKAYPLLCEKLKFEPAIIFAGTGPYLDEVKAASDKYKHIKYLGFISEREEMRRYYSSTEMGLALSGWETFGLSIMESLSCGQVLVGANMGAANEHIENSKCGKTIEPANVGQLVNSIVSIIKSGEMDLMRENARKYASKFSWSECFKKELEIYQKK